MMAKPSFNRNRGTRISVAAIPTIVFALIIFSETVLCFSSSSSLSCIGNTNHGRGHRHIHCHIHCQKRGPTNYIRMTNRNENNGGDSDVDVNVDGSKSDNIDGSDSNRNSSRRPRRSIGSRNSRSSNSNSISSVGPKADSARRRSNTRTRRRADAPVRASIDAVADSVAFDPKKLTSRQVPNEGAVPLDLKSSSSTLRMRPSSTSIGSGSESISSGINTIPQSNSEVTTPSATATLTRRGRPILHNHFEHLSLDDIFPNLDFSIKFYNDASFREDVRHSMRNDIFYTTPAYSSLSPKVAAYMLDDDSSLQGSWNCIPKNRNVDDDKTMDSCGDDNDNNERSRAIPMRMTRLTSVLKKYLGKEAPTGDEFMMKIGSLCGLNPSNHWIDIIGVKDRVVSHSWHQDTGRSLILDASPAADNLNENESKSNNKSNEDDDDYSCNLEMSRYTVMLGFPIEDEYTGTGVFSHALKLSDEHLAPDGHNENEPVLFEGAIDEQYIVRPSFSFQREILRYRDVDTLHSAPDVVYRKSVMRFM